MQMTKSFRLACETSSINALSIGPARVRDSCLTITVLADTRALPILGHQGQSAHQDGMLYLPPKHNVGYADQVQVSQNLEALSLHS